MSAPLVTPRFNQLYRKLNAGQKKAVDTIEGPVIVIAGPGTGKTQVLTLRIANILKETDTPPDAILALTFTESGVAAMRRRLVSIIGAQAYRVGIFTFHGFCNEVIKRFPDAFPRIIGGEPMTDIEKISVIRGIIENSSFDHLKPFGNNFHYVNDVRQKIAELKRENISVADFLSFLDKEEEAFKNQPDLYHDKGAHKGKMKGVYQTEERRMKRTRELSIVYEEYEKELRKRQRYDFEDMIVEVVSALKKSEDLLLRLQEEYQYILADEHQDANTAQNELLEMLSSFHSEPNIFVVGDEKQAIFRFQGASLENFLYFKKRFPNASVIELSENYRSGQKILDSAHEVAIASKEVTQQRSPLVSRADVTGEVVGVESFLHEAAEKEWVTRMILEKIGEGVEPSSIAVLYRTNGEAETWVRAFETRGVSVSVESDQNVLGDPDIRSLLILLKAIVRFGDDELLATALHLPFLGVQPLDVYKLIRYARREHLLIAEVMKDKRALADANLEQTELVQQLYTKMSTWAHAPGSVPELVSAIVRESGFLNAILTSHRAVEFIEKLAGLTRDIEALGRGDSDYSLSRLMEHLSLLDEYRIPIRKEIRAAPRLGSVRLMTAHKAKGLEFDHVYIVNSVDGNWGGRRSREDFNTPTGATRGTDEDERRLFYVALTRARLSVSITYVEEKEGKPCLPMRFLEEIRPELVERRDHQEPHNHKEDLLREPRYQGPTLPDKSFLNELFLEQGLSVTALNNYLACPWNYFYSNLIRIPKSPNAYMLYGTAAHAALRRFFDERNEKSVEVEDLEKYFDEACARLPLSRKDQETIILRGREHLRGWYKQFHTSWPRHVRTEYRIQTEMDAPEDVPKILLRGDVDKIEFGEGNEVRVVDYKTGKPKTRNAIQGNTKSDTGDYWRQLVFYKLLLQQEGKYRFKDAVLDFLQPDDKGRFHKEVFEVSDEDTQEIQTIIKRVAKEIWSLSFWDTRCEDKECEYCALRTMLENK